MALYDHRGRPVSVADLRREESAGSTMSVRNPYAQSVIFGMTPQRLSAMLLAAQQGDHENYLALAQEIERRDGHYYSQLRLRILATTQLERSVQPPDGDETPRTADIVAELNAIVQNCQFGLMLPRVMEALSKGFSVIEIIWNLSEAQWYPDRFEWRDERWFKYDAETARELRMRDGTINGTALAPFKYIVHEPNVLSGLPLAGGLVRIVAALHLYKSYALRDWMAFMEVCGMPLRVGKYQAGATKEQIDELENAVTRIGSDCAAVIPATMEIEFVRAAESGGRDSDALYSNLADWLDKQVSKTVLGTNNVDEQGSFAKAAKMDDIRLAFRNDDAYQLENTLNQYFVKPWYDLNYGPPANREYPRIVFDTSENEDLLAFTQAIVPLVDRGLKLSHATIYDKYGLQAPEEGDTELLYPVVSITEKRGDNGVSDTAASGKSGA